MGFAMPSEKEDICVSTYTAHNIETIRMMNVCRN